MDIQARQAGDLSDAFEQNQRELIDSNRARVRAARADLAAVADARHARLREARERSASESAQDVRAVRRDELQLSKGAVAASQADTAEREARVRELAEAHRMERLHTPERIERAAQRLLEG